MSQYMNNICLFVCLLKGLFGFLHLSMFLGVALFCMSSSLCPSSIHDGPCFHCSRLYTLSDFSKHVKRILTLMLISSPKLVSLLCLYKRLLLLCYTLVLFFLLLGIGFKLNLASFGGCLKLNSHAFHLFHKIL
jgi:hypothetical protein